MEQGDISSLCPVPSHVGGVARGAHPCSGLAVGTGKARGLLCQHCESLGGTVIVFDFLSRNLCDQGLSVCVRYISSSFRAPLAAFHSTVQGMTGKGLILLLCLR